MRISLIKIEMHLEIHKKNSLNSKHHFFYLRSREIINYTRIKLKNTKAYQRSRPRLAPIPKTTDNSEAETSLLLRRSRKEFQLPRIAARNRTWTLEQPLCLYSTNTSSKRPAHKEFCKLILISAVIIPTIS